jgi:protein-S-isoprenylcysteine O-methyltransferase Ste14
VADRVVSLFLILTICAWFLFIPIDVFHLRLLPPPHLTISILGAALFLAGFGVLLTALFQNAFAAPIVKDQSDRGQVLIDTGLYGHIRHPFYLGFLFFLVGIGLWLESYASLLALPVVLVFLIVRTFVAEKTLRETLPGYVGYMARVRCRLIPRIW